MTDPPFRLPCHRRPTNASAPQYSFNVVPELGHWVANDRDSYQYLVESIRKFPKQDDFAQMIRDAGFKAVTHTDFSFGIVAAHSGFKWERPPL